MVSLENLYREAFANRIQALLQDGKNNPKLNAAIKGVVGNIISVDAKFQTFGCAAAIATSSTATDMIIGMTVDEALQVTNAKVVEVLEGLPPQKLHCSVLAEEAIKKAIEDYRSKNPKA